MAFVEVPAHPTLRGAPNKVQSKSEDLAVGSRTVFGVAIGHVVLILIALFCVFPVYWLFVTAMTPPGEATQVIPSGLSLENFSYVWQTIPMGSMLLNTFAMSLILAVAQLFIAILAAYGFAIWNFVGKGFLMFLFVGSWLVPFQVTMIPNYVLVSQLGLIGTIAGVVIPQLAGAFAVLLMVQHMRAFPRNCSKPRKWTAEVRGPGYGR